MTYSILKWAFMRDENVYFWDFLIRDSLVRDYFYTVVLLLLLTYTYMFSWVEAQVDTSV